MKKTIILLYIFGRNKGGRCMKRLIMDIASNQYFGCNMVLLDGNGGGITESDIR